MYVLIVRGGREGRVIINHKTHKIKVNKQISASMANTTRLHSMYTYNHLIPAKTQPSAALKLHSNTQSETL